MKPYAPPVTCSSAVTFYSGWEPRTAATSCLGEWVTPGAWRGLLVWVTSHEPCATPGHRLFPMDHFGAPTELLLCQDCAGHARRPEGGKP